MIRALLNGPLRIFPTPRPDPRKANTMLRSAVGLLFCTSHATTDQIDEKAPAKRPYMTQKRYNKPVLMDNPQSKETETTAPAVDTITQWVTCYRSVM